MITASDVAVMASWFESIKGYKPLEWQRRLMREFADGHVPEACDLPTGLGKTSVITIWVIALAFQISRKLPMLPRRLVYVVNRRTIVDQSTEEARICFRAIQSKVGVLGEMNAALSTLCINPNDEHSPLAIATLRGELAEDDGWRKDPARPTIVVGTVDSIASGMGFCGYKATRKAKAHQAGLLAYDSLVIHDEAHLTRNSSNFFQSIRNFQEPDCFGRKMRVMELSATNVREDADIFHLEPKDQNDALVRQRLNAPKRAVMIDCGKRGAIPKVIIRDALKYKDSARRILIFINSPKDAREVAEGLRKKVGLERVGVLTGTQRGYERSELLEKSTVFKVFQANAERVALKETYYFVSTSAGEVGFNIDGDHLLGDLTTLDSFVQRCGRVNRFGRNDPNFVSDVKIYFAEETGKTSFSQAKINTMEALKGLSKDARGMDVSPGTLTAFLKDQDIDSVFAPLDIGVPVTEQILDTWAMTSIPNMNWAPPIHNYIHGVPENEIPHTTVAWRTEVPELIEKIKENKENAESVIEWLRKDCSLRAVERLSDRYDYVQDEFVFMEKNSSIRDTEILILTAKSEVVVKAIKDLEVSDYQSATFVLPTPIGGLAPDGILNGKIHTKVMDVSDSDNGSYRATIRLKRSESGSWKARTVRGTVEGFDLTDTEFSDKKSCLDSIKTQLKMYKGAEFELSNHASEETVELLAVFKRSDAKKQLQHNPQTLVDHHKWTAKIAGMLARKHALPNNILVTFIQAALVHDLGKRNDLWQKAFGYDGKGTPMAKSGGGGATNFKLLNGYRHEFGTLFELSSKKSFCAEGDRELALHLIASHHGLARPQFDADGYVPDTPVEVNESLVVEIANRYVKLQQKYGWHQLAWLEAIFHSADVLASMYGAETEKL